MKIDRRILESLIAALSTAITVADCDRRDEWVDLRRRLETIREGLA
jgi:hypothetical protein